MSYRMARKGVGARNGLGKPPPKIPEWMECLPAHAMVSALEVAEIFGFNTTSIPTGVKNGSIPPPMMNKEGFGGSVFEKRSRMRWRLGDVRQFIEARTVNSQETTHG